MEQSLRQSLTISNGSLFIFVEKPIALTLIVIAFLSFIVTILRNRNRKKIDEDSVDQKYNSM